MDNTATQSPIQATACPPTTACPRDQERADATGERGAGIVFDIQRHALHDGPGIRTTVFLKGCIFHCPWCHNPESVKRQPEQDQTDPTQWFGKSMTVDQVMDVVRRDRSYYDHSGGGLTVSGGEPFVQNEFLFALLRAARAEGISTCVDTTGHVARPLIEASLPLTNLYHLDYKDSDPVRHKQLTGGDLSLVLDTLDLLMRRGADVILRCPLIPGINDDKTHFRGLANLSRQYPDLPIEILPFHDLGRAKWAKVGRECPLGDLPTTSQSQKAAWRRELDSLGVRHVMD